VKRSRSNLQTPQHKTTRQPNTKHKPTFDLQRLREGIRPFRLHYFPRLRSTNDHAAAMRADGRLYAPAAVLTANQTAGRGRGQNRWFSNAGVLTVTFVMAIEEHLQPHQLPLVAGLAVRSAAEALLRVTPAGPHLPPVQLKWPNDVVCDGRKIAGLLCERVRKCDLIGVGLNVNLDPADAPAPLADQLSSLAAIAGADMDMTDVLIALAGAIRRTASRRNQTTFAEFLQDYDRHHVLLGRRVTVAVSHDQPAIVGRCEGLDHAGRLLVRDRQTLHRIISGHVTQW